MAEMSQRALFYRPWTWSMAAVDALRASWMVRDG
jgi:hypothetical protein